MIGTSSQSWICLFIAVLALPGCGGAPRPDGPTPVLVADKCAAPDVACPSGAHWDGAKCVGSMGDTDVAARPEDARSLLGEYSGTIVINANETPVNTRLSAIDGFIVGDYIYGPQRAHGRLSDCRMSERTLSCTWSEGDLTGTFRVEVAADEQTFSGNWTFADGRPAGTWTGRRGLSASTAVVAGPASPPSSIDGTYRGAFSANGKPEPIETAIDSSTGRITGSYRYGSAQGQLSACKLLSRRLECTWTEGQVSGGFRVEFAPDFSSFKGAWDFSDRTPGGSWSGKRAP